MALPETEVNPKGKIVESNAHKLGRLSGLTDSSINESIQQIFINNPQSLQEFLDGWLLGQSQRLQNEGLISPEEEA